MALNQTTLTTVQLPKFPSVIKKNIRPSRSVVAASTISTNVELAKKYGDIQLAKICGTIASDEKRHEIGYTRIVEKLFEMDPDTTMLAFANMMKKNISMPAELMYDGQDDKLFNHYAVATQRIGVEKLNGLSPLGRKAQEFVCELPKRFGRLEERVHKKAKDASATVPFSWIFGRNVKV
ncbi:hypothetical protein ACFE04_029053 [Oxalis oulophora]